MPIGWIASLRRLFGLADRPARRQTRLRTSHKIAHEDDGVVWPASDIIAASDVDTAYHDAGSGGNDKFGCSAVDTSGGGIDLSSGGGSDGGSSCGGGSSSE